MQAESLFVRPRPQRLIPALLPVIEVCSVSTGGAHVIITSALRIRIGISQLKAA